MRSGICSATSSAPTSAAKALSVHSKNECPPPAILSQEAFSWLFLGRFTLYQCGALKNKPPAARPRNDREFLPDAQADRRRVTTAFLSLAIAAPAASGALAQRKYDTGASDTEIKIGNIAYAKDASDPQWKDDGGMKAFDELLAKYFPDTNRVDSSAMTGYRD